MKLIFPFILFFCLNSTFGQASKVDVIVDEISKINQVQYERIVYGGTESKKFKKTERSCLDHCAIY